MRGRRAAPRAPSMSYLAGCNAGCPRTEVDERCTQQQHDAAPARRPIAAERRNGTFAPRRVSRVTPREAPAFIATIDQLPFSSGQVIVWVPVPLALTRQKACE